MLGNIHYLLKPCKYMSKLFHRYVLQEIYDGTAGLEYKMGISSSYTVDCFVGAECDPPMIENDQEPGQE